MIVHLQFQVPDRGQYVWKNTSGFVGDVHIPVWGATETTFNLSEKWKILTIDAWDNNTGKNLFHILKNKVRNQKTS